MDYRNIKLVALCLFVLSKFSTSQFITGELSRLKNQSIKLQGFNGFTTFELDKTTTDQNGHFSLRFDTYTGMGILQSESNEKFLLVLNNEAIKIKGETLSDYTTLKTLNSYENQSFAHFTKLFKATSNSLAGWKHLLPIYLKEKQLKPTSQTINLIKNEIERLDQLNSNFIETLNDKSYIKWYLPIRKMLNETSMAVENDYHKIPEIIQWFRTLDFKDKKLYNSGLLSNLIESHVWLIENSGKPKNDLIESINHSIDHIIESIATETKLTNEITKHLFGILEKRSLFDSSEYLAIKMLTQNSCTLNDDLSDQLETYRAMGVGKIAPNILFPKHTFKFTKKQNINSLDEIPNKYSLVVFGASWCQKCKDEIPSLKKYYQKWQQIGLEIFFISLDQNRSDFETFIKDFPWLSSCDFQRWDSKTVKDYHVFSTPTMFLLSKKRQILVRPNSAEHLESWINQYLNQVTD